MQRYSLTKLSTLISLAVFITACSSSSDSEITASDVNLSFSDSPVNGAEAVVITVDSITFSGNGDDIVVDSFTSEELGLVDAETFQLDLLSVQGEDSRLVIDSVELPVGEYSNMLIDVIDEDTSVTYVKEVGGAEKELKIPSDQLKLGAFTIDPLSKQSMVVEFGLEKSMTYNPGPDRYILKPRGVRILSVDQASQISGQIDHAALASDECSALDASGVGIAGALYAYAIDDASTTVLGDNFDAAVDSNTTGVEAPYASTSLEATEYTLSYLEPGNYVLAIGCHAAIDDPDLLQADDIVIPNPANQMVSVTLSPGDKLNCDIPLVEGACSLIVEPVVENTEETDDADESDDTEEVDDTEEMENTEE